MTLTQSLEAPTDAQLNYIRSDAIHSKVEAALIIDQLKDGTYDWRQYLITGGRSLMCACEPGFTCPKCRGVTEHDDWYAEFGADPSAKNNNQGREPEGVSEWHVA